MLYEIGDSAYLALTNRCPAACRFCVKTQWGMRFGEHDLRLEREPDAEEALAEVRARLARGGVREIVFCGYGDCAYRLDAISAVGLYVRLHHPGVRVRLNTLGLGSLMRGRDIARFLSLCLDSVSVSLNTSDAAQWEDLHRPAAPYRGLGFAAACVFVSRCVDVGLDVTVTAVDLPEVDVKGVKALAGRLGADFRLRPRLS